MSAIIFCDICGQRAGFPSYRVTVAGPEHPHSGDSIHQAGPVDACQNCLKTIPDLSSSRTLEELRQGRYPAVRQLSPDPK